MTGLTQVLQDGTNTCPYGAGRIGEERPNGFLIHGDDALGSVRQLTSTAGNPSVTRAYGPFGIELTSSGGATSSFGFASEWANATGLVPLRARYYKPADGRMLSADSFPGLVTHPETQHAYVYGRNSPVRYLDPSGLTTV